MLAAGITGTIPSVARLLPAIARLPGGAWSCRRSTETLDEAGWDEVGPSHPQYGLKRLLEAMGFDRAAVRPGRPPGAAASAPRVELWSQVLRPAATTDAWRHELSLRRRHGRA